MKKYFVRFLLISLLCTMHGAMAQTSTLPVMPAIPATPPPIHVEGWTVIKAIGETSMYIPADKAFEATSSHPSWRTFPILLNDTDIAPQSLIITVTLDCATESMRTDRFDVYGEINGKGKIIRSTSSESSEFVPMNDDLTPAGKAYDVFCTQQ